MASFGVVISKNRGLVSVIKINHHIFFFTVGVPIVYGVGNLSRVFLMHVVHYWLVDDIGLIIGLLIWLLGIGFPVLVPTCIERLYGYQF